MRAPLHLVIGPDEHGVTSYGRRTAEAIDGEVLRLPALAGDETPPSPLVGRHVVAHVTDRLLGPDAVTGAGRLREVLRPAASRTLVLHDLPQPSDGAAHARRVAGYRDLADLADVLVVSSAHEARLLQEVSSRAAEVVPHAVLGRSGAPVRGPVDDDPATVATLGFLYPGKGLEEVIDACAPLTHRAGGLAVVNLGRPSSGHADLIDVLTARAAAHEVEWSTTGWLSDTALAGRLARSSVPVAAHRHLSASGSIHSWIGAGRRPLVTRSPYAVELSERLPGSITLVEDDPDALTAAIGAALADPASTWHDGAGGLTEAEVGERVAALAAAASRR